MSNTESTTKVQKEIYKDIPNYEGMYQVSNLGNVKSLRYNKEIILRPALSNRYLGIALSKDKKQKTKRIHQLVAEVFLNHKPNGVKLVVNHINNIKTDNRLENLEVITHRENTNRKHIKGTSKYTGVYKYKNTIGWRASIYTDNTTKYLGSFKKEYDAHLAYEKALKELV